LVSATLYDSKIDANMQWSPDSKITKEMAYRGYNSYAYGTLNNYVAPGMVAMTSAIFGFWKDSLPIYLGDLCKLSLMLSLLE
jgi:hypothetical protein